MIDASCNLPDSVACSVRKSTSVHDLVLPPVKLSDPAPIFFFPDKREAHQMIDFAAQIRGQREKRCEVQI